MSEVQGVTVSGAARADDQVLTVTSAAQHKIFELIQEEGNLNLKLRIFVTGGGCSGYQYGFTFDEEVYDDDTAVVIKLADIAEASITILIDAACLPLLKGSEVDYKEDLTGAQFIVRNPNASTTCGCGSSFSA